MSVQMGCDDSSSRAFYDLVNAEAEHKMAQHLGQESKETTRWQKWVYSGRCKMV